MTEAYLTPSKKWTAELESRVQAYRQRVQMSIQTSVEETAGPIVETPLERAASIFPVSRRDIVRPVVEVANRPQVQFASIGRGSLFEPSDSTDVDTAQVDIRFNPRPDYLENIPRGMGCVCSGSYYSGGAGSWNYRVPESVLPIWIGKICMAPVAPYGGTRGVHNRRFVIESISVGQGLGAGYKELVG